VAVIVAVAESVTARRSSPTQPPQSVLELRARHRTTLAVPLEQPVELDAAHRVPHRPLHER